MLPGSSPRTGIRNHGSTKSFYQQLRDPSTGSMDTRGLEGDRMDDGHLATEPRNDYGRDTRDTMQSRAKNSRATGQRSVKPPLTGDIDEENGPEARPQGVKHAIGWEVQEEEVDNDVPESLLVETHGPLPSHIDARQKPLNSSDQGGGSDNRRRQGRAPPQKVRGTIQLPQSMSHTTLLHPRSASRTATGNAREQALWRWANVTNLDVFMKDVYEYYLGSGFWCIICERVIHLVQSAFVAVFLTFLTQCVDYSSIQEGGTLSGVIRPQCTKQMAWYWNLGLWLFVFYFIWKAVQFSIDTRRLLVMRAFCTHLLDIPEQDMQTVSWQDIISRVMVLRDANPHTAMNMTPSQRKWLHAHSKERLDAIDIASRIMRKDNYLIALINKDVLDLTLPIPFLRERQFFSTTLQWWLYFGVIDLVFDQTGQVNQQFLKASNRGLLSQKLRSRFIVAGLLNLIGSPFWVCHQILIHLLSYYNEFKKDSSTLGDRRYTALAKWKFREFNELPHFFQERINMSYPFASRYMDQFPKRLTEQIAQAVTFMSGAVTFVLAAASFMEPELITTFQITEARTALFYIGVFGTIWALARGMISEDTTVFNPEFALKGVTDFTHYIPDHWRGRLHSFDVKREFSELYKLKIVILAEEIVGIFLTSFILMYSVPANSERIVDFFREFTIHVDGLGYVCSFAEFEFRQEATESKKHARNAVDVRGDYYSTKHGKMAASYYGFLESYVHNPRSGLAAGHVPQSLRQHFQPRPTFPGLNPSMSDVDMQTRGGVRRRERSTRAPPLGSTAPPHSPLTSVLLDPHHQPRTTRPETLGTSGNRTRSSHGEEFTKRSIVMQESEHHLDDPDGEPYGPYESSGRLEESTWQTSPIRDPLAREDSEGTVPGQEHGVLGLIYQFQQVNRDNRMGGGG